MLRLFADGATIVLQALHRTWEPVAEDARGLAAALGHPVQVNAYVTPPQNRGFDDHYDVHDVFVVQVEGEKHWRVRPPVLATAPAQPALDRPPRRRPGGGRGRAGARRGAAPRRLPLPPPRVAALRDRARGDEHPPHLRRPRVDPAPPRRRPPRRRRPPARRRPRAAGGPPGGRRPARPRDDLRRASRVARERAPCDRRGRRRGARRGAGPAGPGRPAGRATRRAGPARRRRGRGRAALAGARTASRRGGRAASLVTRVGRLDLAPDEAALVDGVLTGAAAPADLPAALQRRLVLAGLLLPA